MLQDSYLLQRLDAPLPHRLNGIPAHRVFGGGMLGLSKQAWDILDPICTVAYMGASEYEWGALPKALHTVGEYANEDKLTTFSFVLSPGERTLNCFRRWNWSRKKGPFPPAQYVTVFGLCHRDRVEEVRQRVEDLCRNSDKHHCKCRHNIDSALDPLEDHHDRTKGWVDLDNHFLFFCDETMWRGFCTIFGAEPCEVPKMPEVVDYSTMKKPELISLAVSLGITRNKTNAGKMSKAQLVSVLTQAQPEVTP